MAKDWLVDALPLEGKKIWVAGHRGMVGSAVFRCLEKTGAALISVERTDLDLRDQVSVRDWIGDNKPDIIVLSAAMVGGILANAQRPAEFFYDNMMIATNVIHSAYEADVGRLLFLGSSCIYPKNCAQPIHEEYLLSGDLEETNEAYALAKIAGLKMCDYYRRQYGCDYFSVMPCNLYGVGDYYDAQNSHVIPALILKAHQAKLSSSPTLSVWGTGQALREFLYVDDLAQALRLVLERYCGSSHLNIGSSDEVAIRDLVQLICEVVGYKGDIVFDAEYPDGTLRKVLNNDRILSSGWSPLVSLAEGVSLSYRDFLSRYGDV